MYKMDEQVLCLDIGNTLLKASFFKKEDRRPFEVYTSWTKEDLMQSIGQRNIRFIGLSNVGKAESLELSSTGIPCFVLDSGTPLPIRSLYASPKTLGMDRLAAVIGAWTLYPNTASLIIDAGTCITLDFIDSEGTFIGGIISPGMQMRYKAMHSFTAALPLLDTEGFSLANFPGDSTKSCMQWGASGGILMEVEGFIQNFQKKFGKFNTLLCGGDFNFFEHNLKDPTFAEPNLVTIGLRRLIYENYQW